MWFLMINSPLYRDPKNEYDEVLPQFKDTYNLAKSLKSLSLTCWSDFRISVFQFRPYHWTQLYYDLKNKWYELNFIKFIKIFWVKFI